MEKKNKYLCPCYSLHMLQGIPFISYHTIQILSELVG